MAEVVVLDVCSTVVVENESTVDGISVVNCSDVVGKEVVDETTSLVGNSEVEVSGTCPDIVVGKTVVVVSLVE